MSRSLRVLIVDDELLIADYIALVLEDAGHQVVRAVASGEEALDALGPDGAERLDVAVVDINLKGEMTGIQFATELHTRRVPHLFISGSGDPQTRSQAALTEPIAFLQKPFSERDLLAILGRLSG